ncbi:carboxyltransferase subunit alpha [Lactiplantibacillus carotarum]|uniref:carboxyltransferase subunit alpha n=1 Tax=Lactiplantibacillus carotarum TaxID=2993456 RepID=UPI00298F33C8|nr:carboxyltransferase subunit alpha [Lactiplantibacillus carotarum]
MLKTSAYQQVLAARATTKVSIQTLINGLTLDFFELHGDRQAGDDPAVVTGLATLKGLPIMVIGIQKGSTPTDNRDRHFGCATPVGYRKALRAMRLAERLHRPIVALINTPGAYPGVDAEYQGQGRAIADCLAAGLTLKTPFVSVIVGEGGSGGALALACGDRVWMFEQATYSVLSPEGYATILWKNAQRAPEAATKMRLTPAELLADGVVDAVVPEVKSRQACQALADRLVTTFKDLQRLPLKTLVARRQARYQQF